MERKIILTVAELKKCLQGVDDDVLVFIDNELIDGIDVRDESLVLYSETKNQFTE